MAILYADKKNKPLVSILISVYNGECFLKETLDSLLTQTYTPIEIVVVNDGSTDRSRQIISSYQDKRIIFIDRKQNLGLTKSLNEGWRRARGDYIARLDVGDIALPSRIAEQVQFLEQHPEVGILGAGIELFYNNRALKTYIYPSDHNTIKNKLLHFVNPLPHSTLMIRRKVLEQLSGYCEHLDGSEDYDLHLRALDMTRLASLPKVLVRWRFDPLSISYGSSKQLMYGIAALVRARHRLRGHRDIIEEEIWSHVLQTIEKFIKQYRLDKKMAAGKYRLLLQAALFEHQWKDFLRNAIQLLIHNPLFFINTRARVSAFIAAHIEELMPCPVVELRSLRDCAPKVPLNKKFLLRGLLIVMLKTHILPILRYEIIALIFLVVPLFYFLFTDLDIFLPLITLGIAAFPIVYSVFRRRDLLSPINIFCFLYGMSFGLVPLLQQFNWIVFDPAYALYDTSFGRAAHLLGLAGILFVFLGYYEGTIAKTFTHLLPTLKHPINPWRTKIIIVTLFLISGLSFLFFALRYDIGIQHIIDYFIYTNISAFGRGHLAFLALLYLYAGFIAIIGMFFRQIKHRRFFLIAFLLAAVLAFLSKARGQVLLLVFLVLVFFNYRIKRWDALKLASVFIAMLIVIFLIAQWRGPLDFSITKRNIANTFVGLFTEHQATATLLSQYSKEQQPHFYGKLLLDDAVLSLIPRKIWSTKPERYGNIFVTDIIVPNRQPGFFYTIGPFGTAYADFGYVGILIAMLVFGFIMRVVYDYLKKNISHDGMLLWYALFVFYIWMFGRVGWGFIPVILEKTILVLILYSLITNRFILQPRTSLLAKNTTENTIVKKQ